MRCAAQIHWQRETPVASATAQNESHRCRARGVVGERFAHRVSQRHRAVIVQPQKQLRGLPRDGFAALKSGVEKSGDVRYGVREASAGGRAERFAFLLQQRGQMGRIVYALMAVVRTHVPRNLRRAVEQAHLRMCGME